MGQRFVACDREQSFLMPPDVREWLPPRHLAWFVIDAVAEMDLEAFYAAYRVDGRSRPPYDPAMMVALLLYAYARGIRSSRVIERACEEDVAFRVLAAQQRPDHATIARFVERHQDAIAGLFGEVLTLCARSGLAKVGVIAVDGTKVQANASRNENLDYEQLAREIVEEAKAIDAAEDELYGEARGDELPQEFATAQGRRGWLREAKQRLEAERAANPQPVPRSRPKRVKEAKRRLEEELWSEVRANRAYEAYRARGRMKDGRRFGRPPDPYQPPATRRVGSMSPTPTHASSRACAGSSRATTRRPSPTSIRSCWPPRSRPSAPTSGTSSRCSTPPNANSHAAGVNDAPGVLLADAGYWHGEQMQRIVDRGIEVLIPPDASRRDHAAQLGRRPLRRDARAAGQRARRRALPQTPADDRARVRADEVQPRPGPLPTTRTRRRSHGMATDHRHPQPPQAPPPRSRPPEGHERVQGHERSRATSAPRPRPAAPKTSQRASARSSRPTYATTSP